MNETLKAISKRFSCREYTDQMPDAETLNAIAQAAIQAPSGMNRQHWHVIVVKNRDMISEMDGEGLRVLSQMNQSMYERILSRGGRLFYNAPSMVLVAIKQATPPGSELIDCGILAQNVVLAATSLGVASVHCGFAGLVFASDRAAEFKARLKFPEGYECGIAVLLGYAKNPGAPHVPDQNKITVID